jgi:hypothetical protein
VVRASRLSFSLELRRYALFEVTRRCQSLADQALFIVPSRSSLWIQSRSTSKKRSFADAFPSEALQHSLDQTTTSPLQCVLSPTRVQFAPTSAVEFHSDEPVAGNLTPLPAHVAARRFPTETAELSTTEQADLAEAKRNDALLKSFDNVRVRDRSGSFSSRKKRRRQSFYISHTSDDPEVLGTASFASTPLVGCRDDQIERADDSQSNRRTSRELFRSDDEVANC